MRLSNPRLSPPQHSLQTRLALCKPTLLSSHSNRALPCSSSSIALLQTTSEMGCRLERWRILQRHQDKQMEAMPLPIPARLRTGKPTCTTRMMVNSARLPLYQPWLRRKHGFCVLDCRCDSQCGTLDSGLLAWVTSRVRVKLAARPSWRLAVWHASQRHGNDDRTWMR